MPVKRDMNGRWRYRQVVQLPDGNKQRISGSAPRYSNTKAAAHQAMLDHIERTRHPERFPKRREVPRLADFATEYLENYVRVHHKPSSVSTSEAILRLHLLPAFGELSLDELGPRHISAYKAEKLNGDRPLSAATVNRHLALLRRMLAIAQKWELIDTKLSIAKLKEEAPRFEFLDFEEAAQLVAGADGEWITMIVVALKTGLRQGELLALRWEDIDLCAKRIVVSRAVWQGIEGTPKSGKSRIIPLGERVTAALKSHQHLRGPRVFCDAGGEAWTAHQCWRPLIRARKRAGLRQFGWHALRHTFASHLVMRGAPLKVVQELLGHASIDTTMRYAHLSPAVQREAVRLLDEPEINPGKSVAKILS